MPSLLDNSQKERYTISQPPNLPDLAHRNFSLIHPIRGTKFDRLNGIIQKKGEYNNNNINNKVVFSTS